MTSQANLQVVLRLKDEYSQAIKRAAQETTGAEQSFGKLGGALKGLLPAIGAAGVAFGAFNLAKSAAQAESVGIAFKNMAGNVGASSDEMLAAMQRASSGTVARTDLMLAANRAMALGVASTTDDMVTLMEIARKKGQQMGLDTTQAFDNLVTGLGRASPMILDNLGITIKVGEANEQYARSLGKTVEALTEAEKKQALVNAVVSQGRADIAATGGAADTAADSFARFSVKMGELKIALGEGLLPVVTDVTDALSSLFSYVGRLQAQGPLWKAYVQGAEEGHGATRQFKLETESLAQTLRGLTGPQLQAMANDVDILTAALERERPVAESLGYAWEQWAQQMDTMSTGPMLVAERVLDYGNALFQAADETDRMAEAQARLDAMMQMSEGTFATVADYIETLKGVYMDLGAQLFQSADEFDRNAEAIGGVRKEADAAAQSLMALSQMLGIGSAAYANALTQGATGGFGLGWLSGGGDLIAAAAAENARLREIAKAPRYAAGGVVTRPTLAVVGEAGPEAVVPLRGGSGGGINVTVPVYLDGRVIAEVLGRAAIGDEQMRSG